MGTNVIFQRWFAETLYPGGECAGMLVWIRLHEVIRVAQVISLISEEACVGACQEANQESGPACSPWRHYSKSLRSEITSPAGTFNKKVLIKDKCLCWTCLQGAGQSIRLTTSHLLTNDFHTCVGGHKPIDPCWRSVLYPFNFILKKKNSPHIKI